MNTTTVSPLQVTETRDFHGLTEDKHFGNAYISEPEKFGSILAYHFGFQDTNVLSQLTGGMGNVRTITNGNREYDWDLHSDSERSIEVQTASDNGDLQPGYNHQTFTLILAEDLFSVTDVLVGEDGYTHVRVQENPLQTGNGYEYTVQLVTPNYQDFCNPEYLKPGARWFKEYSAVEEYSDKGGGHEHRTPYTLRNITTTLRKTYKTTRNAANQILTVKLTNPETGEFTDLWTKKEEWDAMAAWYREVDRHMLYSRFDNSGNLKGENGRPVYQGAGLREQISAANKKFYTKLTYELLFDFLFDLSYNAKKWGGDHKFVALTGYMGMQEFDRAMKEYNNSNGIKIDEHGTFITGSGRELVVQGHFRTVKFLHGIELTLKHFPPYDEFNRNMATHPISGKPIESYRFTIMNFGTKGGKNNIQQVVQKGFSGDKAMWYVGGSCTPTGLTHSSTNTMSASGIDGYEVHFLKECGIMVQDPTSCGELIFGAC